MAPTLEDQDRLIVNKLVYRIGEPRRGDIVMLYYPLNPDKSFVKRVIAEEGDTRAHRRRPRLRERRAAAGRLRAGRVPQPRRLGSAGDSRGLLLRDGRPSEQQLRQPALGHGAEEVHHRQGAAALVAGADCACLLDHRGIDPLRREVSSVLTRVLFLNLVVAMAKIAFGYSSGAISILSDGFHSLTDTGSNVVGLVGVFARAHGRPTRTIRTAIASTRPWRPRR